MYHEDYKVQQTNDEINQNDTITTRKFLKQRTCQQKRRS
jgi:hypothetical protein